MNAKHSTHATEDQPGLSPLRLAQADLSRLEGEAPELKQLRTDALSRLEDLRAKRLEAAKAAALSGEGRIPEEIARGYEEAIVTLEALDSLIAENGAGVEAATRRFNDAHRVEERERHRAAVEAAQGAADDAAGEVRSAFRVLCLACGNLSLATHKLALLDRPVAVELAERTTSDRLTADLLESGCRAVQLAPDTPGSDGVVAVAMVPTPAGLEHLDVVTLTVEAVLAAEQLKLVPAA